MSHLPLGSPHSYMCYITAIFHCGTLRMKLYEKKENIKVKTLSLRWYLCCVSSSYLSYPPFRSRVRTLFLHFVIIITSLHSPASFLPLSLHKFCCCYLWSDLLADPPRLSKTGVLIVEECNHGLKTSSWSHPPW